MEDTEENNEEVKEVAEVPEEPVDPSPDTALSPRHRRFAELVASGLSPAQICETMGYSSSRVSVLKNNPKVKAYIAKLQGRIYEEGVEKRLKELIEPSINKIHECLHNRTGKFRPSEQLQVAQWLIEKIDGKAVQKNEFTGSLLVGLMDKLDNMRTVGQSVDALQSPPIPAVFTDLSGEKAEAVQEEPMTDELKEWLETFAGLNSSK